MDSGAAPKSSPSVFNDRLVEVFFLPPMAIARVGSSPTPVDNYEWTESVDVSGAPATIVVPAVSLHVQGDGTVAPYMPERIVFRDGDDGPIRPLAPFFEVWAKLQSVDGGTYERALNSELLGKLGVGIEDITFEITAANRKVERRTGDPSCSFVARELFNGADHRRRELRAFSPHTSGQEPLVLPDNPIPVGWLQVMRPKPAAVKVGGKDVDCSAVR